ncbi:MAG: endolytic transglycosylase MltG [Christensenellaceae bacterium]
MAKKLNNIYLEENEELETHKILVDAKKPKKQKNETWLKWRGFAIFAVSLVIVLCIVFGSFNYVKTNYFDPVDANDSKLVEIVIPKGSSLSEISKILYENDFIKSKQVFKFYVDFSDMSSKLRAGNHMLSKNMDFDDIIDALRKGENTADTIKIVYKEGLWAIDYATLLVDHGLLKKPDKYLEIIKNGEEYSNKYDFVAAVVQSNADSQEKRLYALEGYLFPDTYEYFTDATEEEIIDKQLKRFNEIFTPEYYARAKELGMSVDQVVTMASIIEKEAKKEDFAKVSAVFHNRLKKDMALQSDATIIYALGIKDRINLTEAEINTDSPYNTRLHKGLPIGPIGNPGKAAIEAALYPDEELMKEGEEYLYFLLMDPQKGNLLFTQSYDEFLAAKEEYKGLWEAADKAAADKAALQ